MKLLPQIKSTEYYEELLELCTNDSDLYTKVISIKEIFRDIFGNIQTDENVSFSNIYSRIEYIVNTYNISNQISDKINWIKSFIYKYVKKRNTITETNISELVYILSIIISELSETDIPEELFVHTKHIIPSLDKIEVKDTSIDIDFIKCTILNVTEIKLTENDTKYFSIFCEGTEESYRFSYRMFDSHFADIEILNKILQKYQTVNLFRLKSSSIEKHFYTSTKDSLLILEPDFLVEASEIAECFSFLGGNPNIFFVKKLIPSAMGEAAFKGTLVNGLMDRLICNSDIDPSNTLDELIKENPLRAASIGEEGISKLKNDIISTHYSNLELLFKEKRNNKIKIEPTYISPVYGINGRLDALIEPESAPGNMNIFELKSGKAPKNKSVWQNHKMQIVCYNLLLKSAFNEKRKGTSSILYSSTNKFPFRNVSTELFEIKAVLSVRNQIVSEILNLALNNYRLLNRFMKPDIGTVPPFSINDVVEFSTLLKSASEIENKYYRYNLSFAVREQISSKIGNNGFSSIWRDEPDEKLKYFNLINDISLSKFNTDSSLLEFEIPTKINHNFREGDFAILYKKDSDSINPTNTELFRGKIKGISKYQILFELHNKQLDKEYFSEGTKWAIEHDLVESNIWSVIQSLYDFLRASSYKRELILGLRKPKSRKCKLQNEDNLSTDQIECIKKAVEAEDYFLLQGPPGTGKTSTALIQIVKNIIEAEDTDSGTIVILAYTNRAVEEICSKLSENNIKFLKIGGKAFNPKYDIGEIFKRCDITNLQENISNNKVFVSTVTSFNSKIYDLKDIIDLHTVIIDEASQLYDSSIVGLLCNFRKFILIGDQNQLPAVITQDENKTEIKDTDLNKIGIYNFNVSLFERLYTICKRNNWDNAAGMLETHYRLHDDITVLINRAYSNKLKAGSTKQVSSFNIYNNNSKNKIEKLLSSSRTIFIDSIYERTSKSNYSESQIAVKLFETIRNVYGKDFSEDTLGIITPWRAQISLISKQIEEMQFSEKVMIDTVERFQGSERKIIIVSFAIYNSFQLKNITSLNSEGFDRKLLVTLSRASEQIILLGYSKALSGSEDYKYTISYIKKNGTFAGATTRKQCFGI